MERTEGTVKRTVIGILIMAIGLVMCITAATLFAVSAQGETGESMGSPQSSVIVKTNEDNRVYTGEYYMDGDTSADKIIISDKSVTLSDGRVIDYTFSVWKNMTQTNEATGQITYYDYCFLKTSDENMRYFPSEKEIEVDGRVYKMC